MATWLVHTEGQRFLYYIGWNLGVTVPFRNSVGLAIDFGAGTFSRYADGPILDRTAHEPHFCGSCSVMKQGTLWRMWYLSCTGWQSSAGRIRHHYHLKYAESSDGIEWRREGRVAIDFADESEYAISRPSVISDEATWEMWYSVRGDAYVIGYAESQDGLEWHRDDQELGLQPASSGWDSEMVEYPFVFDHQKSRFMFYNGDGYGRTGFGLAILE